MNHTPVWHILGTALVVAALAVTVAHLAGAGLAYLPAVALGAAGVVLAGALVRFLPEDDERPIARLRDPRAPVGEDPGPDDSDDPDDPD